MNSQDSWIDQDEINQLVSSLGEKGNHPESKAETAAADLSGFGSPMFDFTQNSDDDDTTPIGADEEEEGAFRFNLGAALETDSEIKEEPAVVEISNVSPKPQVVQALEDARNRADRGGLLRSPITFGGGLLPLDVPPVEESAEEKPKSESAPVLPDPVSEEPVKQTDVVASDTERAADELSIEVKPVDSRAENKPDSLRKRLEQFADGAIRTFDATGLSITDFAGYRLFQRGSADSIAHADATSLVTKQINGLSEAVGAPELGSTQISLGENRWLCLVEVESSTGGVLAQLQMPEPMNSGSTEQFRRDLATVLFG